MEYPEEIKNLLTEIRDTQREHLAVYQKVTERSLALQQQSVERQEVIGKLYQRVILTAAVLVIFVIIIIMYLLSRLG